MFLLLLYPLSFVYFICLPICLFSFCFKKFKRVGVVLTCECFVLPLLLVIIIIIIQSHVKSFGSWSEFRIQSHLCPIIIARVIESRIISCYYYYLWIILLIYAKALDFAPSLVNHKNCYYLGILGFSLPV